MDSGPQPPKKRKPNMTILESPWLPSPLAPKTTLASHSSQTLHQQPTQLLSRKETLLKRRCKDEIQGVFECDKRIKFCLLKKEGPFMSKLEQSYLALISASGGCLSAQRIVADLIPRYACHCPTALEAAAKVVIDMHNCSLKLINRGDDSDGIAFETARACIFGLVDVCCAASSVAPTSAVIRGIRSAVFQNVLAFFMSSLEAKDVLQLVDKISLKMLDSPEVLSELKQKVLDEDESSLTTLSKSRALCLFSIFFSCRKDLLAACLELLGSTTKEGASKQGQHFLSLVTTNVDDGEAVHPLGANGEPKSSSGSTGSGIRGNEVDKEIMSDDNQVSDGDSSVPKSCLLMMVLNKDPSLRKWIFRRCKKLLDSPTNASLEITAVLQGILGWFAEEADLVDSQVDSDEDISDSSTYMNRNYTVPRNTEEHASIGESSGKVDTVPISKVGSHFDGGVSRPMGIEMGEEGSMLHVRSSTPRDSANHQIFSSAIRAPFDFRSNSFEGRNDLRVEKNHVIYIKINFKNSPPSRSPSGAVNSILASPNHYFMSPAASTTNQTVWCFDGDPACLDIVSATTKLWVGYLAPDIPEGHIRFQLERFGQIERFILLPVKAFAFVEYRRIIDAIKARHYLPGSFPCRVKFMDVGFGTRGAMNGVAVGSSSHVYVGNISSQWARDEILHESRKVIRKGPPAVIDLSCECALLMEFETPEDATSVMFHLRQFRRERSNYNPYFGPGTVNTGIGHAYMDGARPVPPPPHLDHKVNTPSNLSHGIAGSPHARTLPGSPADTHTRMSHLSSLLASLHTKYNINQSIGFHENYVTGPGNSCASSMREEDTVPSSTLWITIPRSSSLFLTDDEIMTICNLAIGSSGSIVQLTKANVQMGCGWFVECSNVDGAVSVLKNLRGCPGLFFQIDFSKPGNQTAAPFSNKPENTSMELVSPRMNSQNHGGPHGAPPSHPNWHFPGSRDMSEVGAWKAEGYDNLPLDPHQGGNVPHMLPGTQGPPIPPPQQVQSAPFMRPAYVPPNAPWDPRGINNQLPANQYKTGVMQNNHLPFIPASVTPLVQIPGPPMQPYGQPIPPPVIPPPFSSLPPPQPEFPPPRPPSPPPLPQTQPPMVPPPPGSPPPPLPVQESVDMECSGQSLQYQWQGALCKSGVNYCTVNACRADSNICRYSNATSEPAEWPSKLDMTKRTDSRHVKSAFTATPPNRREVCRLIPSSPSDHRRFQDFVTYLKQKDCAGVIKIPAAKSMWARLLFILPYSPETCSMLSIAPDPSDCLIALVLPKEMNYEWA